MIKKLLCITAIVTIMAIASAPAFAFYVNVVEARVSGGGTNPLFTVNGLAASSGKSTAGPLAGWTGGGLTGTGNFYSSDATPVKSGTWSFTPGTTGYYDVYATWVSVTAAQNMPPTWTINYSGGSSTAAPSQLTGGNAWNLVASGKQFDAGVAKTAVLATPGTGTTGKRASYDSVAWAASEAGAVTNTGPANGATGIVLTGAGNDLTWTAGALDGYFNVWFGTVSGSLTQVGTNLSAGTLTFDPDSLSLAGSTQYFWRVDAGNVDRITPGAEWSFTTVVVPEPSSVLAFATGFIGLFGIIRRKRA